MSEDYNADSFVAGFVAQNTDTPKQNYAHKQVVVEEAEVIDEEVRDDEGTIETPEPAATPVDRKKTAKVLIDVIDGFISKKCQMIAGEIDKKQFQASASDKDEMAEHLAEGMVDMGIDFDIPWWAKLGIAGYSSYGDVISRAKAIAVEKAKKTVEDEGEKAQESRVEYFNAKGTQVEETEFETPKKKPVVAPVGAPPPPPPSFPPPKIVRVPVASPPDDSGFGDASRGGIDDNEAEIEEEVEAYTTEFFGKKNPVSKVENAQRLLDGGKECPMCEINLSKPTSTCCSSICGGRSTQLKKKGLDPTRENYLMSKKGK